MSLEIAPGFDERSLVERFGDAHNESLFDFRLQKMMGRRIFFLEAAEIFVRSRSEPTEFLTSLTGGNFVHIPRVETNTVFIPRRPGAGIGREQEMEIVWFELHAIDEFSKSEQHRFHQSGNILSVGEMFEEIGVAVNQPISLIKTTDVFAKPHQGASKLSAVR